jgi:hypothetical protein
VDAAGSISALPVHRYSIYISNFVPCFGAVDVVVGVEVLKCSANTDRNSCTSRGTKRDELRNWAPESLDCIVIRDGLINRDFCLAIAT